MSPSLSTLLSPLEAILERAGEHTSARQLWLLLRLAAAGRAGLEQSELARGYSAVGVSRIAADLARAGWIESRRDEQDQRYRWLSLTPAGRRLFARLEEV